MRSAFVVLLAMSCNAAAREVALPAPAPGVQPLARTACGQPGWAAIRRAIERWAPGHCASSAWLIAAVRTCRRDPEDESPDDADAAPHAVPDGPTRLLVELAARGDGGNNVRLRLTPHVRTGWRVVEGACGFNPL